jgi:hypothetical protein
MCATSVARQAIGWAIAGSSRGMIRSCHFDLSPEFCSGFRDPGVVRCDDDSFDGFSHFGRLPDPLKKRFFGNQGEGFSRKPG